jgi:hypothetical protein
LGGVSNLGEYEVIEEPNKGDENMRSGVNEDLEHMDVNLSIDRKNGGYLVKAESDGYKEEAIDENDYIYAIEKSIGKIKYKKNEEKTREDEIKRVKNEIEAQEVRLEELRED